MKRLLAVLLLAMPLVALAAPMTNEDVIKLVRSGLSDETVLQAIQGAEPRFDTSTDGLVRLKQGGASDRIVQQIMAKQSGTPMAAPAPVLAPLPAQAAPAAATPPAALAAPMTNDDVIKLVKSGLSEETVLQAIQGAAPRFDTSTDGLVRLKQGGASDRVIQQVMAKQSGAPLAAPAAAPAVAATPPPPPQTCPECGTVTSIKEVKKKGSASGVGALTGAVIGGGLGYAVGGSGHRTAGTLIGAGGGALAGNMIEKNAKSGYTYKIEVRLDNGTTQTFRYDSHPGWTTGSRVRIVNGQLTTLQPAG